MNGFADFCRSMGLHVGAAVPDGKWHRCTTDAKPRSKRGAWKLSIDSRIGWAWDPGVHSAPATWRPDQATADAMPFDPAKLDAARAEARQAAIEAIRGARAFYDDCQPLRGGHPYLEAHALDMTGCFGLRIDRKGWLVVPAQYRGAIMTVQRISPDGDKRFWPGAPVKRACYRIERQTATVSVLCEGLATGLALFAAVPTCRVIAAFNSGNLIHAAPQMPAGLAVVASDNDWETEARIGTNTGLKAAQEAADAIGCGVAVPRDIEGTDFSDMRRELVAARMAIRHEHERESAIRRAVDAKIAAEIMRNAVFITAPVRA